MLLEVARFVLIQHWRLKWGELNDEQQAVLDSLAVEWPEMTAKDTTKYASALQQGVSAAVQALAEGLITHKTAARIIAAMAERLGVEIDVDAEIEAAQQEQSTRGKDDLFRPPVADDEGDDASAAAADAGAEAAT
jgi:hypothetical protein